MLQVFGFGAPLIDLFVRFFVWLYFLPLLFGLIGLGFMRDSLVVMVRRFDLPASDRFKLAWHLAVQGVLGMAAATLIFLVIFYRKELYQCITGLL